MEIDGKICTERFIDHPCTADLWYYYEIAMHKQFPDQPDLVPLMINFFSDATLAQSKSIHPGLFNLANTFLEIQHSQVFSKYILFDCLGRHGTSLFISNNQST